MVKKQIKKEVKKPDFFIRALLHAHQWIKTHLKVCIFGGIIFGLCVTMILLYVFHLQKKNDELQYRLQEASNLFRQHLITGDEKALFKAEEIFGSIAKEKKKGVSEVAELYLARIKEKKGETKEAKDRFQKIRESANSSIIRELAERALK
ncbi:MAG: tetratricopeptide repeat protein [Deltaproteobacteria bacterium]|nr:tetratricopeptide repeat protein [Deltaproteobacteria bacterium]